MPNPESRSQALEQVEPDEDGSDGEKADLTPEEREKLKRKFERMENMGQVVGDDFGMNVEVGDRRGWRYRFDNNTIEVDPKDIIEKDLKYCFGVIAHEGSHRKISRMDFIPDEVLNEGGFHYLFNAVEDPRINNWFSEKYSGGKEWMNYMYTQDISIPEQIEETSQGEMGYVPKHIQFGQEVIKKWFTGEYSDDLPEEVRQILENTEEFTQLAYGGEFLDPVKNEQVLPDTDDPDEEEIEEKAKMMYKLVYSKVWPEYQRLVEESMDEEKMRQLIEEMMEEEDFDIPDEAMSEPMDLPEDLQEELQEQIEEQLDQEPDMEGMDEEDLDEMAEEIMDEMEGGGGDLAEEIAEEMESKEGEGEAKQQAGAGGEAEEEEEVEEEAGETSGSGGEEMETEQEGTEMPEEAEPGGEPSEAEESEGEESEMGPDSESPLDEMTEKQKDQLREKLKDKLEEKKDDDKSNQQKAQEIAEETTKEMEQEAEDNQQPLPPSEMPDDIQEEVEQQLEEELEEMDEQEREEMEQEAQEQAEENMEELEEDLNEELEGEFENEKEERERKEREDKEEEKQKREQEQRERERELERKKREIEKELERQKTEYDRAYDEVSEYIDDISETFIDLFLEDRWPQYRTQFPGQKLRLEGAKKYEAKKDYTELFESRVEQERKSYNFLLLVDLSPSMEGEKIEETFKGVVLFVEALEKAANVLSNISVRVTGFQDYLIEYKEKNQRLDDDLREGISKMVKKVEQAPNRKLTNTGYCLMEAAEQVQQDQQFRGGKNFIFTLTDGMPEVYSGAPSAEGFSGGRRRDDELHYAIEQLAQDPDTFQLGIGLGEGTDYVEDFFSKELDKVDNVANVDIDELAEVLSEKLKQLIQ